jgi:hypothetical protein
MAWYNETLRHSLSAQGVSTSKRRVSMAGITMQSPVETPAASQVPVAEIPEETHNLDPINESIMGSFKDTFNFRETPVENPMADVVGGSLRDTIYGTGLPGDTPGDSRLGVENPLSNSISGAFKDVFSPEGKFRTSKGMLGEHKAHKAEKELLIGGVADGVPDEMITPQELKAGMAVEMEHTNNPKIAKEIAKDHIVEHPKSDQVPLDSDYYQKLDEMETALDTERM